jgi:hypothetical protein
MPLFLQQFWGRNRLWTFGCVRVRRRDCRRGQSLVVWGFNEGRGAARECERYLMGQTDLPQVR